ncbi:MULTISPECIES: alpha/beta hydrolase [unclassified Rhodococcus (in: high G+C Gram-positive bacteria)]|uniref:alpha/beta hydrolase n=1 Tax=unclassified Rhodococcus (in: high G+C Gram-positive bacteria) TaxID=192944 RepID=UPI00163B0142|nr:MULTISPECIES: alpha/beta hydrolase [unclassified Rhodococcus (in: high G+C Gram-positive bacteria)]MBC2640896.1 alpha/beta hydrolase [Rhodococcus sp. 3A]MBC2894360.1 alpha/beta hydrolase [Rhodococcus sp. 4CII]
MHAVRVIKDLEYATTPGGPLTLDIYRSESDRPVPTVLYLHGGGWEGGDKADNADERLRPLAEMGVAVVSVNYRLAPGVRYPAQMHDVKAALRWLRAEGSDHDLQVERIGIWGASAGGYLAIMAGLSAGNAALEGTVGSHLDQSSAVQAVVTWFSPTDLLGSTRRTRLESLILNRPPAVHALFGRTQITGDDAEVRSASPMENVHAAAPPFLIAHGDLDRIVPASDSHDLFKALARRGVDVTYAAVGCAGHEDPRFDAEPNLAITAAWLKAQLSPRTLPEAGHTASPPAEPGQSSAPD